MFFIKQVEKEKHANMKISIHLEMKNYTGKLFMSIEEVMTVS